MIGALDEAIDNAAFTESFLVRFLGSMEVKQDRGKYKQHFNPYKPSVDFKVHWRMVKNQVLHCLLTECTFKDICSYFPCAHFLRRETDKVGLGLVFRPSMNSDRYRFQILLIQIDIIVTK